MGAPHLCRSVHHILNKICRKPAPCDEFTRIRLFVCLFVCLSVCLFVCLCVCPQKCLPNAMKLFPWLPYGVGTTRVGVWLGRRPAFALGGRFWPRAADFSKRVLKYRNFFWGAPWGPQPPTRVASPLPKPLAHKNVFYVSGPDIGFFQVP